MNIKNILTPKIILALVVLVLLILSQSFFIVKEGQSALKIRLGQITSNNLEPGIHFLIPIVEKKITFDSRLQTLDAPSENIMTNEKKELIVDYFVEWRIADTRKFYVSTRGRMENAANIISQIASDDLREEFAKRTVNEVVSKDRSQIMEEVANTLSKEVSKQGLAVVDVRVKRVEFSDSIKGKVFSRMQSERTRVSESLRAAGREAEASIRAKTDKDVQIILAKANRDAEILRGEGEAKAAKIYANAYGKDEDFYRFSRSLEAYEKSFNSKDDSVITSPKSSFFDYLKQPNYQSN